MTPTDTVAFDLRRRAALTSLGVGLALLALKFAAYFLTHSTAVLSDALESIINVIASGFAFYSILRSARPPDTSHPYGYGRIEFFSAGFEGALIIVAAFSILWAAIPAFVSPAPLAQLDLGLGLLLLGGAINYGLGTYLIRSGRRAHSDTLIADGHHVHSDAYTSFAVILGLLLVRLTGWLWLDPLVATMMALNILRTGWRLLAGALAALMDRADAEFLARVAAALEAMRRPGWLAPHHLRSWRSGAVRYIDLHLILPRFWDLDQAHAVQKAIEAGLAGAIAEPTQVIVHFDPCLPAYCAGCDLGDCPVRAFPFSGRSPWLAEALVAGPPHPRARNSSPPPDSNTPQMLL